MTFHVPESIEECIYFTNRAIGKGQVLAWVYRKKCPKCGKARMGKPVSKGKVLIKASEYVCPNCDYRESKEAFEASVQIEAQYTCPKCEKSGETTSEYRRKKVNGIPSYIIICQHCGEKIPLTKKMKGVREKDTE